MSLYWGKHIVAVLILLCFTAYCQAQFYSKEKCDSIYILSNSEYNKENYKHAIELLQKIIPSLEKILGRDHDEYLISLTDLCIYNAHAENYDVAIDIIKKVIKIKKKKLGEKHTEYASSIHLLALLSENINNYQEAIIEESKALSIFEYNFGNNSLEYAESLEYLGHLNHKIGKHSNAIYYGIKALKIRDVLFKKKNEDYAIALSKISDYYASDGQYANAIKFATEGLEIKEEIFGTNSIEYAYSLGNIALIYRLLGKYEDAKLFNEKALIIGEKILGREHPTCLIWLNNLTICYYYLNNISKAIEIAYEVLNIRKKILGDDHIDYAMTLHNIAPLFQRIGNVSKAIELEEEVLNIYKKNDRTLHLDYAEALNNLATYYSKIQDFDRSLQLYQEALIIYENLVGKDNPKYLSFLTNLSGSYSDNGNIHKAIVIQKEAINRIKKTVGKEHPDYILSLRSLADCYARIGNLKKAYTLLHKALNISNNFYPESAFHNGIIADLSWLYYYDNNYLEFEKYWREYFEIRKKETITELKNLTSKDRISLIENNYYYFKYLVPNFAIRTNNGSLVDLAYNSALMFKGIILDTEIELSKMFSESKDSSVINLFNELQNNYLYRNELIKNTETKHKNIDSIDVVITDLEYQLINRSRIWGDYTKNISIDWKQIQDKLSENDIAIEIISFPFNNDSIMYYALTIKKGYNVPKMIQLFEEKQLLKIHPRRYYTSNIISNLVWKPLEKELSEVKNVYFSPDGELYNIAIESLQHYKGNGFMFDEWNFYRLSSTRELVKKRFDKNASNIILYGGLDYNANILDIDTLKYIDKAPHYSSSRSYLGKIGLKSGFLPLENTLPEVKQIDSLYSTTNVPRELYIEKNGTESSFKQLSGKKISNLHIATHGFYWNESILNNQFVFEKNTPVISFDEKEMTQSGLIFSGANNVLAHQDRISEGYNDGVLTAQEISTLDFHGLDLLVLSACQTALGEIKGDGVFGLQRGFKKAGAQTIMMSLWEVDDVATKMLMTEFYKCLISGLPKQEAFLKAQKVVRDYKGELDGVYKDFSNPRYWAAFIMLDGLY